MVSSYCIITQNIENIKFLQHGLTDKSNIIVSPLPDYKYTEKLIETSNNKIIVGIIGAISTIKGLDIVRQIIKTFQNTQIEIIVFGIINIPNFNSYYPYKNISELNNLLIKHKPNMLFEPSLVPETYSYTLTIAMITQLPILYLYKPFDSVIKNRLSIYKNAYEYKNINELKLLVYYKKQDFFYTIKPIIYYPSFWDCYFSTSRCIDNSIQDYNKLIKPYENIVIITSKIYISNNPFSYVQSRSIYLHNQRFNQTIDTINSLRNKIPNVLILLCDNSNFSLFEYNLLKQLLDVFINPIDDELLNYFTNTCLYKSHGEIAQTYKLLDYIYKYIPPENIHNVFKITGRYTLNDSFSYNRFNNSNTLFKLNTQVTDRKYFFTCFYKINKNDFSFYYGIIKQLYENIQNKMHENIDLEVLLPSYLYNIITNINTLGIQQNIAVWNDTSNI